MAFPSLSDWNRPCFGLSQRWGFCQKDTMNTRVVGGSIFSKGGGAHVEKKPRNDSSFSHEARRVGRCSRGEFGFPSGDSMPRFVATDQFLSLEKRASEFNHAVEVVQLPNIPNPSEGPVVDIPENYLGVRAMLIGGVQGELDPQSVYHPERVLTGDYWDTFALLPSIIPDGVMGIYGLGGGSLARICDIYYPRQEVVGWEVDPTVVELANEWMGLQWLQKHGKLTVHIGDCLSDSATVRGGFAGLVIDVFDADGLMEELTQKCTWERFKNRLMGRGRILANMYEYDEELCNILLEVFEGSVSFKVEGRNFMALTGPPPNQALAKKLPLDLKDQCFGWLPIEELVRQPGKLE